MSWPSYTSSLSALIFIFAGETVDVAEQWDIRWNVFDLNPVLDLFLFFISLIKIKSNLNETEDNSSWFNLLYSAYQMTYQKILSLFKAAEN